MTSDDERSEGERPEPPELRPEDDDYDLWCELNIDGDGDGSECCRHCGKEFEDFSDMGCGYCDSRHPEWGLHD
jgi:hypothetical protein